MSSGRLDGNTVLSVRRVWSSIVVLAAIAVFGVAGYLIVHHDPVPQAGQAIGFTPPSVITSQPSASPTPPPTPPVHASAKPVVAFLGDDYTAGTGASTQSARFTSLVCKVLRLTEKNFGVNGSGYANTAAGTGDYLARVAAVVAAKPDIVVVSGGRRDVFDDTATAAANASKLFGDLRANLPHAVLVAVAPMWGDSAPQPALADIAGGIKAAVTAAGGTYLDISDPLRGHPTWMADAADPNDAGYAAIATAVETALKPLLPDARHPASAPTSGASG
jgi:acyl-CoA thioesterase I